MSKEKSWFVCRKQVFQGLEAPTHCSLPGLAVLPSSENSCVQLSMKGPWWHIGHDPGSCISNWNFIPHHHHPHQNSECPPGLQNLIHGFNQKIFIEGCIVLGTGKTKTKKTWGPWRMERVVGKRTNEGASLPQARVASSHCQIGGSGS